MTLTLAQGRAIGRRIRALALCFCLPIAGTLSAQSVERLQNLPYDDTEYVSQPGEGGMTPDTQALIQRLEATEKRLADLEHKPTTIPHGTMDHQFSAADGNPKVPTSEQRIAAIEKSLGGGSKSPSYPTARLSGFFHVDSGYFGQDAANRAALGDIQDGTGFRRARLQAVGSVSEFTNYSLEMDFATAGRPSFMDVWGEQTHLPVLGNLRIGHFRQATTMDALTSIRQLEFLERSLPFQAFDPFRRVGAMAYDKSEDEMTSWAYGVFKTGGFANAPIGDSRFATDIGDQGGYSVSGRATHLLYYDEPAEGRYLLHIGGHYDYSRLTGNGAGTPFYQSSVIPEFFVGDPAGGGATNAGTPAFLNTGRISADSFHFAGAQIAGQYGAAHFQAEYMFTSVNQLAGPQVFYDGAYAQAGYFLTGENRTYNRMFGTFDRITPYTDFFGLGRTCSFCGWGAWELTGRWSYVNLSDPGAVQIANPAQPVVNPPLAAGAGPIFPNAGYMNEATAGVNWYWNPYTKMQFCYMHCFLNDRVGNSNCDILAGRFQVEF